MRSEPPNVSPNPKVGMCWLSVTRDVKKVCRRTSRSRWTRSTACPIGRCADGNAPSTVEVTDDLCYLIWGPARATSFNCAASSMPTAARARLHRVQGAAAFPSADSRGPRPARSDPGGRGSATRQAVACSASTGGNHVRRSGRQTPSVEDDEFCFDAMTTLQCSRGLTMPYDAFEKNKRKARTLPIGTRQGPHSRRTPRSGPGLYTVRQKRCDSLRVAGSRNRSQRTNSPRSSGRFRANACRRRKAVLVAATMGEPGPMLRGFSAG